MTSTLPRTAPGGQDDGLMVLGLRPSLPAYLRSLWDRRDFVVALPVGQLRSRNANTVLGSFWHLLNPLALAATYYVVFGLLFDARDDIDNYVGFLVIGLFVFHYTQKCATGGAAAMVRNEGIVRNISLPRAVFPVSSVLGELLAYLPALALLLVLMLATGEAVQVSWLLLLPLLAVHTAFNLGLALWVGRLTYHFRDVQNLLPFVMRLWLYMSGVFFTVSRVPEGVLRTVFEANPLQVFIALHRAALMDGSTDAGTWAAACAWTLALLVTGLVFFWAEESSYGRA